MAKKSIEDYAREDGTPTDSDFRTGPVKIVKEVNSRMGAVKDACSGLVNGMMKATGPHKGSGALESVLISNEKDMFNDLSNMLTVCAQFMGQHFGYVRNDMLNIALEMRAIADQCNDDGRDGLDRFCDAMQAMREAEAKQADMSATIKRIIAAHNNDDAIAALKDEGISAGLIKAVLAGL